MDERICYKSAPLGGVRCLEVHNGFARLTTDSGELKDEVRLADVVDVRFADVRVRYTVQRRLELVTEAGVFRLSISTTTGTEPSEEPVASYLAGAARLLDALHEQRPELDVEMGEGRRMRIVWFSIGAFSVLMSAGILVAALLTGVDGDKMAGAAVPMLVLAAFGAVMMRSNVPWAPWPRLSSKDVAVLLRAWCTGFLPEEDAAG